MGAFVAYKHLAQITGLLKLSSVEPYMCTAGTEGVPPTNEHPAEVLEFSHFYDMDHMRSLIKKCSPNNDLVSFDTFLEKASRDVILVSFLASLSLTKEYFSGGAKNIIEHDSAIAEQTKGLKMLNTWMSTMAKKSVPFRESRVVLINALPSRPLPLSSLVEELGSIITRHVAEFGSATVIVDTWRDVRDRIASPFFYYIPGLTWEDCGYIDSVRHSEAVVTAARTFGESLKSNRPLIGVHLRMEKLLIFNGRVSHYRECLGQVLNLLENGTIAGASQGTVYFFHDLKEYGSKTCDEYKNCIKGRPHFLADIESIKYDVVSYDPSSFLPASMRGVFAGLVELEYLSNVDVLITVGTGRYQDNTVQRFLSKSGGSRDNLYRVCFNPQPIPPGAYLPTKEARRKFLLSLESS
jgi:hypothetical protein